MFEPFGESITPSLTHSTSLGGLQATTGSTLIRVSSGHNQWTRTYTSHTVSSTVSLFVSDDLRNVILSIGKERKGQTHIIREITITVRGALSPDVHPHLTRGALYILE
jgi:hypothetical protein